MRTLHVAALPFPTTQGTQALIRTMLESEALAGRDSHLLTYAAAGYDYEAPFVHHRVPDFPQVRALDSGPSVGKIALDVQLARTLRRLLPRLRPRVIVAHHVEAAAVVALAGVKRWCFVAHTDLQAELPSYAAAPYAALLGPLLARAGGALDWRLVRSAPMTAAVSPLLRDRLRAACPVAEGRIRYLPPPIRATPSAEPGGRNLGPALVGASDARVAASARALARQQLGLTSEQPVLLYAGNLDAYQGTERLLEVLAHARQRLPACGLLVATESDPQRLQAQARRFAVDRHLHIVGLADERQRARVHAAADVALIVRRAPGGVPIKLLDAMARGVPVVLGPTAAAGLSLEGVCAFAGEDSVVAMSAEVVSLLSSRAQREALAAAGRTYVEREHGPLAYLAALDDLLAATL